MVLEVTDLSIRFGKNVILEHVDLAGNRGEMIALIGPNGAGKTSMIRAVAGLVPYSGAVQVDAVDVRHLGDRQRGRTIAYLAQGQDVHWPIAARDVVALGRLPFLSSLRRMTAADADAVGRAMARTEVDDFAERDILTLSAGERARVLLARALAAEAPVLLADEPVAALDPYHQLRIMAMLRHYAEEGALVVVVLHDLTLAARFCHRLALIADGRLLATGEADDVLTNENLASAYHIVAERGRMDGMSYIVPRDIVSDTGSEDAPG